MNACIGDDFSSLLYLALTSSVFLYTVNCPLERVELDLSHPPPPHPSPLITVGHPSSLWRGGVGAW
jgi:hypothetical protein